MDKRLSQRQSSKLLAAAIASVGLAGISASQADAGIVVDVRAAGINGDSGAAGISGDRKTVLGAIGDTVTFNIVVRISGTDATQTVGNWDGFAPATDTRNNDSMNSLVGAFTSGGGDVKLNFDPTNQGSSNQVAPWNAPGATNGAALDFDSDGDLDLGATGTDPTNMWAARAASPQFGTIGKKTAAVSTRFGVSSPWSEDFGGPNTGLTAAQIIDATTAEMLMGELTAVITAAGATPAFVQFVPRANGDAATALWFEDGITTGKNPSNSPFGLGAPVQIIVPEPGTLGLAGIASLGLLARRRNKKA